MFLFMFTTEKRMTYGLKLKRNMSKKELSELLGKIFAEDTFNYLGNGKYDYYGRAGEKITMEIVDRMRKDGIKTIAYDEERNKEMVMKNNKKDGASTQEPKAEKVKHRVKVQEATKRISSRKDLPKLIPYPIVEPDIEKRPRGRPVEHQENCSKITVVLKDKQIHWLDHLTATIRFKTKTAISRTEIIRALVAAAEEGGEDFSQLKSEDEIKERILKNRK